MLVCRPWAPPAADERSVALPGPARALTEGPTGLLELVTEAGSWTHFEATIAAPAAWLPVVFRCSATMGGLEVVLDVVRLADVAIPTVAAAGVMGLLFSIRGRPTERFRVEAWPIAADLPEARIAGRAWAHDGVYGDRASRLPVDLFARPGQQRPFTTGPGGLAVGAPVIVLAANPFARGRVAITQVTWTKADAGAALLTLQDASLVAIPVVRRAWALGAAGIVSETIAPPLYSIPDGRWELLLSAGAPASNQVNLQAFDD